MALLDFLNKKKTTAETTATTAKPSVTPVSTAKPTVTPVAAAKPSVTPVVSTAKPSVTPVVGTAKPPVTPVAAAKPPVKPDAAPKPRVESSIEIKSTGELQVIMAGIPINFSDGKPYVEGNEVMVPIRELATHLEAKVDWDAATKTATLSKDDDKVEIVLGTSTAKVNGKNTPTGVVATTKNERIFLPIRFLAESLGASYEYDAAKKVASIF